MQSVLHLSVIGVRFERRPHGRRCRVRRVPRSAGRHLDERAYSPVMNEEARDLLLDAAREMIASYHDEGREPPIGGGHVEQVTIGVAEA